MARPVSLISGSIFGVKAFAVEVEIDIKRGLPLFNVVGLPDRALKESRERVRSALKNCNFSYPDRRITINLAPAHRRKEGPQFDLPIALGILASEGLLPASGLEGCFIAGELALTGEIRPVQGLLPLLQLAAGEGCSKFIFPAASRDELAFAVDMELLPVENLQEAVEVLGEPSGRSGKIWKPEAALSGDGMEGEKGEGGKGERELPPLQGQHSARRAAAIAAAGYHNLLLFGPPGSGKTTIARTIPLLMPPLSAEEKKEVMMIASAAGETVSGRRPWRDPHHSITAAGLGGGGSSPRPGEVTLAHRGVLFLDELPEFKSGVLELLRQPLQDGYIHLVRHGYNIKLPADFMMVAALNPCPCGYLGQGEGSCRCTPAGISRYRSRLSGPFLDRIDLQVEVPALSTEDIIYRRHENTTERELRSAVKTAWQRQRERNGGVYNSGLNGRKLQEICSIGENEKNFLSRALESLGISRRGYDTVLRLARTIADLAGEVEIGEDHLAEAINYRDFDRNLKF